MLIRDSMDAVQSPISGEWYDSKSKLRSEYKREGVIETGNERAKPRDNDVPNEREIANSIAEAWNNLSP